MNVSTKYFLEKMSNLLDTINKDGFVFKKFDPSIEVKKHILSSDSPDSVVLNFFTIVLNEFGLNFSNLHMVYEDIRIGMHHELHSHLIPADYQAVVWVPQDTYAGREFLYGTPEKISKFKPCWGDICLMKTNDLNYIHGVDPLLNNTLVRTLLISVNCNGYLGEHLTVDANNYQPI